MSAIDNSPTPKQQFVTARINTQAKTVENTFGTRTLPGHSGAIALPKVAAKRTGGIEPSVPPTRRTFKSLQNDSPEFNAHKE